MTTHVKLRATSGIAAMTVLLALAPAAQARPPGADLSISMSDAPDPAPVGSNVRYSIAVGNAGPSQAMKVSITDQLPSTVTFVSASTSQGSCSGTTTVTCDLGTLASGASANVSIDVTPNTAGKVQNSAIVSGQQNDPDTANNSATTETTVSSEGSGGGDASACSGTFFFAWTTTSHTCSFVSAGSRLVIDGATTGEPLYRPYYDPNWPVPLPRFAEYSISVTVRDQNGATLASCNHRGWLAACWATGTSYAGAPLTCTVQRASWHFGFPPPLVRPGAYTCKSLPL